MADLCCPPIVGGKVYVTWNDRRLEASGDVTAKPAGVSREAKATNSGRLVVTETAIPMTLEMDLWDICGADPMELYQARCHVNVVLVAISTGKRYYFSDAAVVGDVSINVSQGTISGLQLAIGTVDDTHPYLLMGQDFGGGGAAA